MMHGSLEKQAILPDPKKIYLYGEDWDKNNSIKLLLRDILCEIFDGIPDLILFVGDTSLYDEIRSEPLAQKVPLLLIADHAFPLDAHAFRHNVAEHFALSSPFRDQEFSLPSKEFLELFQISDY